MKTIYRTDDGTEFSNKEEAEQHEQRIEEVNRILKHPKVRHEVRSVDGEDLRLLADLGFITLNPPSE